MTSPSKVLAMDIGNSYTKIACFVDGVLEATEGFPTDQNDLMLYREELQEAFSGLDLTLSGLVVSDVVPAIRPQLEALLHSVCPTERLLWLDRTRMDPLDLSGVTLTHYAPNQLGTDRIANLVAAHRAYPGQRCLVCDIGTTTTLDLLDESGNFLGGAICPGPKKFQALVDSNHAAQLYQVDVFESPKITPGPSTSDSLANGLYYGYKGAMLEIIGNLMQSVGWPLSITTFIFTGGFAAPVRAMLQREIPQAHIDPSLTLNGLYILWQCNIISPSVNG